MNSPFASVDLGSNPSFSLTPNGFLIKAYLVSLGWPWIGIVRALQVKLGSGGRAAGKEGNIQD